MTIEIKRLQLARGSGGFWVQDQPAIQTGAKKDGFFYEGTPKSEGFRQIKEAPAVYCVDLSLSGGVHVFGDCVTVVNVGYAGRPAPIRFENMASIETMLKEKFEGKKFASFTEAARVLETLALPQETALPIAYGVSQALLGAAAHARGLTMAEVIADEFACPPISALPGFAGACEGDWYANVDKAIVKGYAMFPHCGIQRKEELDILAEYVTWMLGRIAKLGGSDYKPDLHIDFHSMLGRVLGNDMDKVCDFLALLNEKAKPYQVYFEDPLLAGSTLEAREHLKRLRERFDSTGSSARLIADEWANSPGEVAKFAADDAAHAIQIKMPDNGNLLNIIAAVRACDEHGVLSYLGGSVNETDISARVTVHLGLALHVWRMLSKPGKGLDEGYMLMSNEMARTCARLGIAGPFDDRA